LDQRSSVTLAQSVTGPQGRFALSVGEFPVVIQALRIGQRPQTIAELTLRAGEVREITGRLRDEPVVLAAQRTSTRARCEKLTAAPGEVASAYAAAAVALRASRASIDSVAIQLRVRVAEIDRGPGEERDLEVRRREVVLDSLNPFRSIGVDSLAKVGYVTTGRDGRTTFRAPDADVLVSDQFLAAHCLYLAEQSTSEPEWLGVGFRPAELRRGVIGIHGTMWIDRRTFALRRVEFQYAGIEPMLDAAGAGGWMDFVRLPNGLWITARWELRMPQRGEATALRRRDMQRFEIREVTGIVVRRGEVLDVSADARPIFTAGAIDVLEPRGEIRRMELPSASPSCARTDARAAVVHVHATGDAGRALDLFRVEFAWTASDGRTDSTSVSLDETGRAQACALPRDRDIIVRAVWGGSTVADLVLRIAPDRDAALLSFGAAVP